MLKSFQVAFSRDSQRSWGIHFEAAPRIFYLLHSGPLYLPIYRVIRALQFYLRSASDRATNLSLYTTDLHANLNVT